jgi:hypothetical protein
MIPETRYLSLISSNAMRASLRPSLGLAITIVARSSSPRKSARSRTTVRVYSNSSRRVRASSRPRVAVTRRSSNCGWISTRPTVRGRSRRGRGS